MKITATKKEQEFIIDNYSRHCPKMGSCLIYSYYYGSENYGFVFRYHGKYYCITHNSDSYPGIEYICNDEQEAIDKIRSYT